MTYTPWQRTDHVREIQEYLRIISQTDNNYPEIAVDGIYGGKTIEAVRAFQQAHGLPITGAVDFDTWEQLSSEYPDTLTLLSAPQTARHFPSPQHVIRRGDKGNLIYILQAILNAVTEAHETVNDLIVNGEYDEVTAARVKSLQHITGFAETGEVDRYFWDFLITWYNNL